MVTFPRVHLDGSQNVYDQLRRQLAAQIRDGTHPVGMKLPTVRAFASHLGIAANTVARTYRELEAAGLIVTRGRAGSFVASGGDRTRERAAKAARGYAATTAELGLPAAEALAIVTAALQL